MITPYIKFLMEDLRRNFDPDAPDAPAIAKIVDFAKSVLDVDHSKYDAKNCDRLLGKVNAAINDLHHLKVVWDYNDPEGLETKLRNLRRVLAARTITEEDNTSGGRKIVPCPSCNGTGRDEKKTRAMYTKERSATGYVRCWTCNGNGIDSAEAFRWSDDPKKSEDPITEHAGHNMLDSVKQGIQIRMPLSDYTQAISALDDAGIKYVKTTLTNLFLANEKNVTTIILIDRPLAKYRVDRPRNLYKELLLLIDEAIQKNKPLIIFSNELPPQLEKKFTARTITEAVSKSGRSNFGAKYWDKSNHPLATKFAAYHRGKGSLSPEEHAIAASHHNDKSLEELNSDKGLYPNLAVLHRAEKHQDLALHHHFSTKK